MKTPDSPELSAVTPLDAALINRVIDEHVEPSAPATVEGSALRDSRTMQGQRPDFTAPRRPDNEEVAFLVLTSGPDLGHVFRLVDSTTLGRERTNVVAFGHSSVSRNHAVIVREAQGRFVLCDNDSANGTYVNGERVQRHVLRAGDNIQLGFLGDQLRFSLGDASQEALIRRLYETSTRDTLTGAINRRHFFDRFHAELAFSARHRTPLALVMLDIDHFKRVNDTWGHQAGDRVLCDVATFCARAIRVEDIFGRYGGEEFTLLLRNVPPAGATRAADRLRQGLEAMRIGWNEERLRVTISAGVALTTCCQPDNVTAEAMIAIADARLYEAKAGGRNRVVGPAT